MKIIDQTPFYNEKGEISLMDRAKAFMQFGKSWGDEMEAQKSVLSVLEKVLDKNYTLLRNVTPPGVDIPIPFILVGPTGIYVMYVTPLLGMFRAKGDQWGTISGNAFKPEKINLLTRTERMARTIQVYLQRQGYSDLNGVEAVLVCANSGIHVDSLRPIVRVVMRDALERFAVSIMQARVALSPDAVYDVVTRIVTPPALKEETPAPAAEESPIIAGQEAGPGEDVYAPVTAAPASEEAYAPSFVAPEGEKTYAPSIAAPAGETPPESWTANLPTFLEEDTQQSVPPTPDQPPFKKRKAFSRKQWFFLAIMGVLWFILIAVFIFLVVKDLYL